MDIKRAFALSTVIITSFTLVPLGINGMCNAAVKLSDRVVYSVASGAGIKKGKSISVQNIGVSGSAWDIEAAPLELETPTQKGQEIPTPTPTQQIIDAIPYINDSSANDGTIEKINYGEYDGEQYFTLSGGGQVRNCTSISNETLAEYSEESPELSIDVSSEEPQVLIYHTHTTETYELEDKDHYDSSFTAKTTDPEKNMTAVGDEICGVLEEKGISVIHDTLVHDYPSYDGAYDSSRQTVSELLEKYPSIKIALDIHRDGIETTEGVRLAPVAEIDGKSAAQIMIISCCDDGTGNIPEYSENFKFACAFQSKAESLFPTLTRPILFDYRFYNQDLTTASLLIEVGSHGNTLEQAKYSGRLIGEALAALIGE